MYKRRLYLILILCLVPVLPGLSNGASRARAQSFRNVGLAAAAPTKYALLVGINQYPDNALNGCVNDVMKLRELLINSFDFPAANVIVVTDKEATRANILAQLDGFGPKLQKDDLFVFAYSGHGTLFPDSYSEEQDETESLHFENDPRNNNQPFFADGKYDAAICPVDSRGTSSGKPWHNLILDDELFDRFSRFTAHGSVVNYLTDSCFSGTQGRDLFKTRSLKLSDALGVPVDQIQKPASQHRAAARDLGGRYLVISSSNSLQPSSEWRDDAGQPCGLFSYVFQKLVALQNGKITYKELYENSEYVIKKLSKDNQDPQIDTRFYSGSLDEQVFSVKSPAPAAATATPAAVAASTPTATPTPVAVSSAPLKVLLLVTNAEGKLLDNCSFAIFKPGVVPIKGQIKLEDTLMIGRTDANGVFNSETKRTTIKPGVYPIKVVREGYQTFLSTLEVKQSAKAGYALLAFRLAAE